MHKITSAHGLKQAIEQLESDQARQADLLKSQFAQTVDYLRPKNLIIRSIRDLLTSPPVLLMGVEKIKSMAHLLIDKCTKKEQPIKEPDSESI